LDYGFSVATGAQRERGYILIPGLRTAHVAPIINIGMSAPDWIKFITSYVSKEKTDLEDPNQMNELIFNPEQGMFFQGLKWRIQDPSDAAGYGIGINTLNSLGILADINPQHRISEVSRELGQNNMKDAMKDFAQIFNPSVFARAPAKEIIGQLKARARGNLHIHNKNELAIAVSAIRKSFDSIREAIVNNENTGWYAVTPKEK
jgi:hypothetical protein